VLGLNRSDDEKAVRRAYLNKSRTMHPDRGGDPEEFKVLSQAYEVLKDEQKRRLYDAGGLEAVQQGGLNPQSGDPFDLFERFRRGGEAAGATGPRKGKAVVHELQLSLEELYRGTTRKFQISRKRCRLPEGMAKEQSVTKCEACNGQGGTYVTRRTAMGLMSVHESCAVCSGQGSQWSDGVEVKSTKVTLEVVVEAGAQEGTQIVKEGEAEELPGALPGDVVFVVREKPHETFQRRGPDLLMEMKVSLADALCGIRTPVKMLDGRTILVTTPAGQMVRHKDVLAVDNEGMPIHGSSFNRGRLFVAFDVQMPLVEPDIGMSDADGADADGADAATGRTSVQTDRSITPATLQALEKLLPGRTPCHEPRDLTGCLADGVERGLLQAVSLESFGDGPRRSGDATAYDSDDEQRQRQRGFPEGGVACAQQ